MIKLVIYDFDGTIANTFKLHLEAYSYSLKKFGHNPIKKEIITKCFNKTDKDAAEIFGIKDISIFSDYYRKKLLNLFDHITLYPESRETLQEIKNAGLLLGMATALNRSEIDKAFKILNIKHYFDSIVTHDEVEKKKPNPEIFLTICNQLSVKPNETIIIGDSKNDLIAANKMGAKKVLYFPIIHNDYYSLKDLMRYNPSYVIGNHLELIKIIKDINTTIV